MAVQIESKWKIDHKRLMDAIWAAIYRLFGEYGASKVGLSTITYDEEKLMLILRCSHKAVDMVRAAIAFITEIEGKLVSLQVVAVSGTIKALKRKLGDKIAF